jgi:hypothetical protein
MQTTEPLCLDRIRIEAMSREQLINTAHTLLGIACASQELTTYAFPIDGSRPPFESVMELVEHLADVIDDAPELPRH